MPVVDARAIVVWAQGSTDAVNTMHVSFDDAVLDFQAAADAVRDGFVTHIVPQLSNGVVLTEVKVGDDVMGAISISGAQGGKVSNQLPPNCAFGVSKGVSSGRNGRWFIPGVVEDEVDNNGRVNVPVVAALNGALSAMLTDLNAAGVSLGVLQAGGGISNITSLGAKNFITVQNRRLDRARGF